MEGTRGIGIRLETYARKLLHLLSVDLLPTQMDPDDGVIMSHTQGGHSLISAYMYSSSPDLIA